MTPKIEFWFELASTYSYIAAARVEAVAADAGVGVDYRPFLLGPIFKAQGWNDSPFNIYPAKGRYMWRDLERLCARYGLPFRKPDRFPQNGLLAARVILAAESEPWTPDFVRAVYQANFAEGRDISDRATLSALLAERTDAAEAFLDRAGSPEVKARLRAQTDEARERGIFGAPSFTTRGELFWGSDRLEDAVQHAAGS